MMADSTQAIEQQEMTFFGHLKELRRRVMYALLVLLVVFLCLFYFANDIYSYLSVPLRELLPDNSQMIATEVSSTFFAPFKLVLFLSFVIAMPYLLFQVWGFIAPGLYKREKAFVIPVFALSVLLFYLGIAFAYYVVFPVLFSFFTSVGPEEIVPMTDINQYLSFAIKILVAFGLAFEVPIVTLFLVKTGISDVKSMSKKRPYVILGCFVVAMLMTPPDLISQTLLAIPMWLLFEAGLLMSRWFIKPKADDEDDESTGSENEGSESEKSGSDGNDDGDEGNQGKSSSRKKSSRTTMTRKVSKKIDDTGDG